LLNRLILNTDLSKNGKCRTKEKDRKSFYVNVFVAYKERKRRVARP